jgi:hypothetical protein
MRVDVALHRVVDSGKPFLGESTDSGLMVAAARGRPAKANKQRFSLDFRCIARYSIATLAGGRAA